MLLLATAMGSADIEHSIIEESSTGQCYLKQPEIIFSGSIISHCWISLWYHDYLSIPILLYFFRAYRLFSFAYYCSINLAFQFFVSLYSSLTK